MEVFAFSFVWPKERISVHETHNYIYSRVLQMILQIFDDTLEIYMSRRLKTSLRVISQPIFSNLNNITQSRVWATYTYNFAIYIPSIYKPMI